MGSGGVAGGLVGDHAYPVPEANPAAHLTLALGGFEENARDLEIFLDVLSAVDTPTGGHLMDPRYDSQLDDAERQARDAFERFMEDESRVLTGTSIGRGLAELYWRPEGSMPKGIDGLIVEIRGPHRPGRVG